MSSRCQTWRGAREQAAEERLCFQSVFGTLAHIQWGLLIKAGVPVHVVSERAGHKEAAFTMSCYAHVLPDCTPT